MENLVRIDAMKRADQDYQLALSKAGPDHAATKLLKRKLEIILDACGARAPKMNGHA